MAAGEDKNLNIEETCRMNKGLLLVVFVVSIVAFTFALAKGEETRSYSSPDRSLEVKIRSIGQSEESSVAIVENGGRVVSEQDYSSQTGTNGLVVEQATWTPDGQFFVFSASSSGGHQPWKSPMFFYSRRLNKIFDITTYLPPVASSLFAIKGPDIITVTVWTPFAEHGTDGSIRLPITFKLGDLLQQPE